MLKNPQDENRVSFIIPVVTNDIMNAALRRVFYKGKITVENAAAHIEKLPDKKEKCDQIRNVVIRICIEYVYRQLWISKEQYKRFCNCVGSSQQVIPFEDVFGRKDSLDFKNFSLSLRDSIAGWDY